MHPRSDFTYVSLADFSFAVWIQDFFFVGWGECKAGAFQPICFYLRTDLFKVEICTFTGFLSFSFSFSHLAYLNIRRSCSFVV